MREKLTSKSFLYKFVPAILVAITVVAAVVLVAISNDESKTQSASKAQVSLVDTCQKTNTITYTCYKKLLDGITKTQGPEKAFSLVKEQYSSVPYVKSQCHQLVHVIGRSAYAKYGNIADTFAHGDQYCWSGYYHGVMEQLTDEKGYDYTVKNANSICAPIAAKEKYTFYHYNCVHGLGHGFMEALDNDLFASLDACNKLTDTWEAESCYGGVFMQNIMNVQSPDETADHTSKYLRPSEPMYPCTAVDDKYKQQCYMMQTSYALQVAGYDFSKIFTACAAVEPAYRNTCYTSLGRDASGQSISDPEKSKATCMLSNDSNAQMYCIEGAVRDFVSYFHSDVQAKQLCSILAVSLQPNCYETVQSYYSTF